MKQLTEVGALKSIKLFRGLTSDQLQSIVDRSNRRQFPADRFLYYQGDSAEKFYLLLHGKIKLTQINPEGQQIILHYASPGQAFAVIAALINARYPVSAQAAEHSITLTWDRNTIQNLMIAYPKIALNALEILADRTREFQNRVRELSTERVERRIARALIRLARQTGVETDPGILIDLPITRQDLAEMTGTTLYTVSRTLSQWEKEELIQSRREKIIICYPHGLVVIAEDLPPSKAPPLDIG